MARVVRERRRHDADLGPPAEQRRELLDFMTIDHRAAADMGVAVNDAREWAYRPFWRA
jgi:hypothetical protein